MPSENHPLAFGRKYSLGSNRQHQYVYRRGKSFSGKLLVLVYLRGREFRAGFSASSKVGNAVCRNRLRRIMREDIRLLRPELKPGKYVLILRSAAAAASHAELSLELERLLRRADVRVG